MIQEAEIRDEISQLLMGRISIDQLRSWLNAKALDMHRDSPVSAQRLAGAVGLLMAEHLIGDRTDDEIREVLYRLAATVEQSADIAPSGRERLQISAIPSSTSRVSSRELLPVLA